MARTNLNALCDATIAHLGGMDQYAKILARDLRKAMEMSQQPLATARELRISLQAHNIAIGLNREADKGNRDDARLAMEADEARDVVLAEIKQQIFTNPELRKLLLATIEKAEEKESDDTLCIEVTPESVTAS